MDLRISKVLVILCEASVFIDWTGVLRRGHRIALTGHLPMNAQIIISHCVD